MQKEKTKVGPKLEGGSEVEPQRIELMVRDALERESVFFRVDSVDVRISPERKDVKTITQGRFHVYGFYNHNFKRFEGTFKLTGYRSSHTPLGLDHLYLSYNLDSEVV